MARMGSVGGDSVHCVMGRGRAGDAVFDVAESRCQFTGEIAGGNQFPTGGDRNVGPALVYTGVFGGDRRERESAFAGCTLFSGRDIVSGRIGSRGRSHAKKRSPQSQRHLSELARAKGSDVLGGRLQRRIQRKGVLVFLNGGGRVAGFFQIHAEGNVDLVGMFPRRIRFQDFVQLGVRIREAV